MKKVVRFNTQRSKVIKNFFECRLINNHKDAYNMHSDVFIYYYTSAVPVVKKVVSNCTGYFLLFGSLRPVIILGVSQHVHKICAQLVIVPRK